MTTWSNGPALPSGVYWESNSNNTFGLLANGKILLAGGVLFPGSTATSACSLIDPVANTLTATAILSNPTGYGQGVALPNGDFLMLAGSQQYGLTPSASTYLYDHVGGTWSVASVAYPYSGGSLGAGLVVVPGSGRVFAFGGTSTWGVSPRTDVLEWESFSWVTRASMHQSRWNPICAVLNSGRILVAGGNGPSGGALLTQCEIYDPVLNAWTVVASLNTARGGLVPAVLASGQVVLVGGAWSSLTAEIYDPVANTWTQISVASITDSGALFTQGFAFADGRVGFYGTGTLTKILAFDGLTWQTITGPTSVRDRGAVVYLAPLGMYVAGGSNEEHVGGAALLNTSEYTSNLDAAVAPTISTVSPSVGSTLGGSSVTITGTGFTPYLSVTIGGSPASSVVVVSPTSITCVSPVHSIGAVDVNVTNRNGGAFVTAAGAFTYEVLGPHVTNFVPAEGATIQGFTPIGFDVTDVTHSLLRVIVTVRFPGEGIYEVVHDGDGFAPKYSGEANTLSNITGGHRYTVLRQGGWPENPAFEVFARDSAGLENS